MEDSYLKLGQILLLTARAGPADIYLFSGRGTLGAGLISNAFQQRNALWPSCPSTIHKVPCVPITS